MAKRSQNKTDAGNLILVATLVVLITICWQLAAHAQGLNAEQRQNLIERYRQARANGTLGRGGMRGAFGGGSGIASAGRGMNGAGPSQRTQIDPAVLSKIERSFNLAYGPSAAERFDLYLPKEKPSQRMPILIYFHGGGWQRGDKNQHGSKCANFAQYGMVVVNADYGLAPQVVHPQQILDVAKVIKYSIDHAGEWGGDPDRIFLMGHSAGAHLVDLVATNQRFLKEVGVNPTSIKGVISLDTASLDLQKRTKDDSFEGAQIGKMIEQEFGTNPAQLKDASPTLNIQKGTSYPKFLMYCGVSRRTCMEQHRVFARLFGDVGGQVAVKPVPLSHRDINLAAGDGSSQMFKECRAFIESGNL